MRLRSAALAIGLAGCWLNTPPPVAPPDPVPETATLRPRHASRTPCELAIDHFLDLAGVELDGGNRAELRAASVESCQQMDWSEDLIHCVQDLVTPDDVARCRDLATPDQLGDLMHRLAPLSP